MDDPAMQVKSGVATIETGIVRVIYVPAMQQGMFSRWQSKPPLPPGRSRVAPSLRRHHPSVELTSHDAQSGVDLDHEPLYSRRSLGLMMLAAPLLVRLLKPPESQAAYACPGLNGYALQKCLREARQAREEAQAAAGEDTSSSVEDERARLKQYDQPGTLVTLPSGVQYRELDTGLEGGTAAQVGDILEIQYTVYRLSSGAYFKYSSGGTPVLLWALGSGFEGRDDLDEVYRFTLGTPKSLPAAATPAVVGMRPGGRRRILIPPRYGWVDDQVGPRPPSFGAGRRLANHRDEPLLLEVLLRRVLTASEPSLQQAPGLPPVQPFKLPAPPSPYRSNLGQG